jgi:putative acetyltransferase
MDRPTRKNRDGYPRWFSVLYLFWEERGTTYFMAENAAFRIRLAERRDADCVQNFVFAALRSYGINPEPEGLDAPVVAFGMAGGDGSILEWVAELWGGPVVGAVALSPTHKVAVADLSLFYVDTSYRGKGIGRALLEHVIWEAKAYGFHQVDLITRTIFEHAVHLYESLGWVRGPDLPPRDEPDRGPDRTYFLRIT